MTAISDHSGLLDRIDLVRLDVGRRLDAAHRAVMGQFFTPTPIARFMADLCEATDGEIRLLDPGAGIGSLSAAWIVRACSLAVRPLSINLTAYESDPGIVPHLRGTLDECGSLCRAAGVRFEAEVVEGDFIKAAVDMLTAQPLWGTSHPSFNHAILNPPYRKLNAESETRRVLRSVGIETSNLYAAFLWLVFRLLDAGGEMVAITPRSFCNGPYFRPFRQAFLREMALSRIHVFESRNSALKDADVLQENVIFRAVKCRSERTTVVSSSASAEDPDVYAREVPPNELVDPKDPDLVIHVVPDEIGLRFAERVKGFTATLDDLRIQVSTGRVVDFRAKDALAFEANGRTVPLIYPVHFESGFIAWPKSGKKPNYLVVSPKTENLLVPAGTYVLVKRFSAKEEKRRVTAAICEPSRLPADDYGFENHLNYFHQRGNGLPPMLAKGLAAYLNSTLVDTYFRQFSGHTQVNATDLRNLRYPDLAALERIGRRIGGAFPNQDDLDALIAEELRMTSDDPVKTRRRLEQAREILASLGLPKAQQNERSALTLLALLDLPPTARWSKASAPLRGITPMMDWFAEQYGKRYAPNTRETVRRQTVHQFMEAGIIAANPDDPARPINSLDTVYQIEKGSLELIRTYGTKEWDKNLRTWLTSVGLPYFPTADLE
jgi:adenine-specific DNA-methyltransferase